MCRSRSRRRCMHVCTSHTIICWSPAHSPLTMRSRAMCGMPSSRCDMAVAYNVWLSLSCASHVMISRPSSGKMAISGMCSDDAGDASVLHMGEGAHTTMTCVDAERDRWCVRDVCYVAMSCAVVVVADLKKYPIDPELPVTITATAPADCAARISSYTQHQTHTRHGMRRNTTNQLQAGRGWAVLCTTEDSRTLLRAG